MNHRAGLGSLDRLAGGDGWAMTLRLLLPSGWLLAIAGYFGPWLAHPTAALTLSGADMGEFVKFLPGVIDGSLRILREAFYLPPLVVVVGVALLSGSQRLRYPRPLRLLMLVLAVPTSLQLLPPAWSPKSLMTAEFRLQAIGLGICWLLLAGSGLLGRLPLQPAGAVGSVLALAAGGLSAWQFLVVKPAIDRVYIAPPSIGWGFFLSLAGLLVIAGVGAVLIPSERRRGRGR